MVFRICNWLTGCTIGTVTICLCELAVKACRLYQRPTWIVANDEYPALVLKD
jgi:hypothetical protein